MVNYQNSKIYKLYSPSKNLTYIGSTTQILCKRLVEHLSKYKAYKNDDTKNFVTSFLVLECEDYKIELLEEYVCNNRQQLEKKEGEHIRNNECVNKVIVGRTHKQYYNDNADKMKEYRKNRADKMKEYQTINRDKIKEYDRQYRLDNADKIKERNKQRRLKKKAENQL